MRPITSLLARRTGATLAEYSILAALMSAVVVAVLFLMGVSVGGTFQETNDTLVANSNGNGNGNGPGGGNNGNGGGNGGGSPTCFTENGGDSSNSFNASNRTTCFDISNGADQLTTNTNANITVDVANGDKTLVLNGTGMKTLTATDLASLNLTTTGTLDAISTNVDSLTANITSNTSVSLAADGFNTLAYTHTGSGTGSLAFGALASYGASIQTGGGAQTVSLAGRFPTLVSTGNGNDTVSLSGGQFNENAPNLNMGTGTNVADLACVEQVPPNRYTSHYLNVRVHGEDTITSSGCQMWVSLLPSSEGSSVKSLDVSFSQAPRTDVMGNQIRAEGAFSNLSVTGTSGAATLVRAYTNPEYMQGPITIDLTGSFYGADNRHDCTVVSTHPCSWIAAEIGPKFWLDDGEVTTAPNGAYPANIRLDMSAHLSHPSQPTTSGGARIWMTNPGSWIQSEIVGMTVPNDGYRQYQRNAVFGVFYQGDRPGADAADGVPVMIGNDATLNISITQTGACWNARLVDTSGANPDIALPEACTGAGTRILNAEDAPADDSFAIRVLDLSVYNRLVFDRPGALTDLVYNFNGAPGDPGLDIAYLTINHP